MNVLISSLGTSPGVVTSTVDALKYRENVEINEVITISTSDERILNKGVEEVLRPEFKSYKEYQNRIYYNNIPIESSEIISLTDNQCYLTEVFTILDKYFQDDNVRGVYISLAGGRKTMSALIFSAMQIIWDCYHDSSKRDKFMEIVHIIIDDPDIEMYGNLSEWEEVESDYQLKTKILHPFDPEADIFSEKIHLIKMSNILKLSKTILTKCDKIKRGEFNEIVQLLIH